MTDEINYQNNPLNGVSLKILLTDIVDYYGFEILFAYLNINCFKTNPSIDSSVKFLKKTDWAREKVEAFYLYEFKNLPNASAKQLSQSPRDRVIPDDQTPGEPAELNLDEAERLRQQREKKAAEWNRNGGHRAGSSKRFNAQRGKPSGERSKNQDNHRPWQAGSGPSSSSNASVETSASAEKNSIDPWAKSKNKSK